MNTQVMREALERQFRHSDHELVDIVAIPAGGDRMVRMRTLEEALEDFDTISYLVQVRPATREEAPAPVKQAAERRPTLADNVYLPNGKLNAPYLLKNAELLFASGEYALARNIFKTLLTAGEKSANCLYWMGRCCDAEGKPSEARAHYEESIAYQPTLDTYRHLASLLVREGKDQPAAEVLERALGLKDVAASARAELHLAAGNCWTRVRKGAEAERHFLKSIELEPGNAAVRSNLATLYLQSGQHAEARLRFEETLAADPRAPHAWAGLGACQLAAGDKRGAHDAFARSLDLDLANPTAIFHLVSCAYEIKSYVTAVRIVEEYVQSAPVNASLLYSLAGLQFHLGRMDDARGTLRRILDIAPAHAGAKELLKRVGPPVMEDGWQQSPATTWTSKD